MEFECGNRLVAIRDGRVMDGKIYVRGSSETFYLAVAKKDIVFPEMLGNDKYIGADSSFYDNMDDVEEIMRIFEYADVEESVYKGDRGNILYFTASSCTYDEPCQDIDYLISIVTQGPLSGTVANSCNTIVWAKMGVETPLDYVLIQDEAFCSTVNLARHELIPKYIEDYVRNAQGGTGYFKPGIIRNGVYDN